MSEIDQSNWRGQVEDCLAAGRYQQAHAWLAALWSENQTLAGAGSVLQYADRLRAPLQLRRARLRLLRSCTLEPALVMLRAGAFVYGLDLETTVCPFNTYAQEILDPESEVYRDSNDIVVLAVSTRALAPELWQSPAEGDTGGFLKTSAVVADSFRHWAELFRSRSRAPLVMHMLEEPPRASSGILDDQREGQLCAIRGINERLRALAATVPDVYVLDYDALVARHGRLNWWDESKWRMVRVPLRADFIPALSAEWLRFVLPLRGRTAKVAVTDLDNTMWGGILGEDGLQGIRTGRDDQGIFHWNYQHALLDLQRRGILLAIASKNNPADVLQALESHPGLLLRKCHFSAIYANWQEKSLSIRQIAEELNVGLDSLVFLDDNPVERHQVRLELPQVTVLEMPAEASGYERAVRDCPLFERLSLSREDLHRTQYYVQQRERRELEGASSSVEEFLHSLQQHVEVLLVRENSVPRVAQLTQKTNQFNLTTRRYSEAEIRQLTSSPDHFVMAVRVTDRFGDNGLVGVCILGREGKLCRIEALLLSCRVIGRSVESAMLSAIASTCRQHGVTRLEGWFLPTRKNAPAADFYQRHGFRQVSRNEEGSLWSLDLETSQTPCPACITLMSEEEAAFAGIVH